MPVSGFTTSGGRFHSEPSRKLFLLLEAEAKLREWMGASERGEKAKPQTQELTYAELRADLLKHYAETQHKSLKTKKDGTPYLFPLTALDNFFNGRRVNDINRDTASAFVTDRRAANKCNNTINNSLRLLIRMFSLAQDDGKLTVAPKFELLKEKSRQGFLPPEAFQKLFAAMPVNLQPILLLLYHSGVRVGEAERIYWPAEAARGSGVSFETGNAGRVPKGVCGSENQGSDGSRPATVCRSQFDGCGRATSGHNENKRTPRRQRFSEV